MAHECPRCTFVANRESIYISPQWKAKAVYEPLTFGVYTMKDWVGHTNFYLFKCSECQQASVDYLHGYTSLGSLSGLLFLSCLHCNTKLVLDSHYKNVYESEGFEPPPSPASLFFKLSWKRLLSVGSLMVIIVLLLLILLKL